VELRIRDSQIRNKNYYDEKRRDEEFEIGDLVSLYTPHTEVGLSKKVLSQKKGPYRVVEKHSPVSYTVALVSRPEKLEKVHIRRLVKWHNEIIPELDDFPDGETPSDERNAASKAEEAEQFTPESTGVKIEEQFSGQEQMNEISDESRH